MKKTTAYLLQAVCILLSMTAAAQNVAINGDGSLPNPNAALDIKAAGKGLLIPRVSSSARLIIPNTKGLLVYDTTAGSFWYNTGAGWKNIVADSAGYWSLNGNSNGGNNSYFIGTRDFSPFLVKVNDTLAGRIDPDLRNVFWGYQAGLLCTTAISRSRLDSGYYPANTAIGYAALRSNITGRWNTAVGTYALYANDSTISNTAIGFYCLRHNIGGNFNTGAGEYSLYSNRTGSNNAAYGEGSMANNLTGYNNTAIGSQALISNGSGYMNTAVGYFSGGSLRRGYGNTFIGAYAYPGYDSLFNATAIGYNAIVDAPNKVRIGNNAVTVIEGQVPFTTPSDGRFKYEVKEDVRGLDFILQLRPVTYRFDVSRFDAQHGNPQEAKGNTNTNYALQAAYNEASLIRRSGFIAQEVEKAAKASGYDFSGIITPKTEQEHYSLSYESFVVPLVKAVQEQQKTIDAQNKTIAGLQQQLDEIKQLLQHTK